GAEEHRPALGVPDRAEGVGQAELADHLGGQVGRPSKVVGGAGGPLADHHQLSGPAAEADGQRVQQVVLAVHVPVNNGLMSCVKLTAISLLPSRLDSLSVSGWR